uniref:Uncharacterized protein n=1 Tax=Anguilla anguilla TaxID=7936 RepID=A0A0E9S733_ANGAN
MRSSDHGRRWVMREWFEVGQGVRSATRELGWSYSTIFIT